MALLVILGLVLSNCGNKREGKPKVLVFSKTMGFKHASIPDGIAALQKLGSENGFEVDTTKNAELFNEENLQQYSAIIFLSTTMNVLDHKQEAAFERYIQAGGGFVGIHAATDTEYDWGWYNKLVGASFFHTRRALRKRILLSRTEILLPTNILPIRFGIETMKFTIIRISIQM